MLAAHAVATVLVKGNGTTICGDLPQAVKANFNIGPSAVWYDVLYPKVISIGQYNKRMVSKELCAKNGCGANEHTDER
jgi:hypothetical protein